MHSRVATTQLRGRIVSLTLTMLHQVYAGPDASKRMARDAGTSHRTSEKWWAALTTPRADVLLRMAAANEQLRAELLRRLGAHGYADQADTVIGGDAVPVVRGAAGTGRGLDRPAAATGEADALRTVDRRAGERRGQGI